MDKDKQQTNTLKIASLLEVMKGKDHNNDNDIFNISISKRFNNLFIFNV